MFPCYHGFSNGDNVGMDALCLIRPPVGAANPTESYLDLVSNADSAGPADVLIHSPEVTLRVNDLTCKGFQICNVSQNKVLMW